MYIIKLKDTDSTKKEVTFYYSENGPTATLIKEEALKFASLKEAEEKKQELIKKLGIENELYLIRLRKRLTIEEI